MGTSGSFFGLPPELMTALGVVAGYGLAGGLTANQMNALGNFLMVIGQILETIAAQKTLLQGQNGELAALWAAVQQLQQRMEG